MTSNAPTFRNFVNSFTDFLTVAIHTILYERSIYPKTSFLSARKYNFPVRQNRHPKVCEWINDAINAVEAELLKGTVARVAVVIYDSEDRPRERFMFDTSRFPKVPATDVDMPLGRTVSDGEKLSVLPTVDMEEQFRATISKLANCGSLLQPLSEGCTFTVVIELKDKGEAPLKHPQPWIPVQPAEARAEGQTSNATTKPIRAVAAGDMVFETWIEEASD